MPSRHTFRQLLAIFRKYKSERGIMASRNPENMRRINSTMRLRGVYQERQKDADLIKKLRGMQAHGAAKDVIRSSHGSRIRFRPQPNYSTSTPRRTYSVEEVGSEMFPRPNPNIVYPRKINEPWTPSEHDKMVRWSRGSGWSQEEQRLRQRDLAELERRMRDRYRNL